MSRLRLFADLCVLTAVLLAVAGCNIQDTAAPATRDTSVSEGPVDAVSDTTAEDGGTEDLGDADLGDTDLGDTDPGDDSGTDAETCPSDQELCASGCADTSSDPQNCGACESPCVPPANAEVLACQSGDCTFKCDEGYFDLNDDLSNPDGDGCEADCKPSNGGVELCIDGIDNDCNGQVDDGCNCNAGETFECGTDVGECELGTITCQNDGTTGACENAVEPTADVCDGLDNNCDGEADEDFSDKGQPCTVGLGACERAGTYVCNSAKDGVTCDATQGTPSVEICDNVDNDCNGQVDDNVTAECGTSVGECSKGIQTCSSGSWGSCVGSDDGGTEICDGLDNDCDGIEDEGVKTTYYRDEDDDGYGTASSISACNPSGDYTATSAGDCNDSDDTIHPGATQFCSGSIDNDCDGDAACADSDCNGEACLAPGGGTCQGGSCVPNDDGCQVLCRVDEYCTCGGTECCPDGQLCACR